MNVSNISAKIVHAALDYYSVKGYVFTDCPIVVPHYYNNITKPVDIPNTNHDIDNSYIGSAEQSFLKIYEKGKFKGKHLGLAPCFRNEKVLDDTHFLMFLKCELFSEDRNNMKVFISDACDFYDRYCSCGVIETSQGYDIIDTVTKIELGSYGITKGVLNGVELEYSYGTGLAEPRLSYILQHDYYRDY